MVKDLGSTLKKIRLEENLSVEELSARVGLSIRQLEAIETGESVPPVTYLKHIATALNTTLAYIFQEMEDENLRDSPVQRRGDRVSQFFPDNLTTLEILTNNVVNKKMEPLSYHMKLGGGSSKGQSHSHEGEEWWIVLKGVLEIKIGEDTYTLGKGDTIYFDSKKEHSWRNGGNTDVHIIVVASPPAF